MLQPLCGHLQAIKVHKIKHNFKLPQWSGWKLRSSELLHR